MAIKKQSNSVMQELVGGLFDAPIEQRLADELARRYLASDYLESKKDISLLRQLIYLEVTQKLLQRQIGEYKEQTGGIPLNFIDALHKNLNKIIDLKEKLGLLSNRSAEVSDGYLAYEQLLRRLRLWREQNQITQPLRCCHCGGMLNLYLKAEQYEISKHPYFMDRLFGNECLIELYQSHIITKEHIARILNVSSDYAEWLVNLWSSIKSRPTDMTQQPIDIVQPSDDISQQPVEELAVQS